MDYHDKTLTCIQCSLSFTLTAEDQQHHAQGRYSSEPKRCPFCSLSLRDNRSSKGYGSDDGYQREMYPATCAQCGKQTEVPFQPRGYRPVYCRDCYERSGSLQRR